MENWKSVVKMVANHSYNGIEDSQDMFISNPK